MEKDQLSTFRQPLVTAAGIILGFILNFVTALVKRNSKNDFLLLIILLFILTGIVLLIVVLYRILNNRYNRSQANKYYKKTLIYFLAGVISSFIGGILKMAHTFFHV